MKTISKIIYTVIVIKFLMGIRERLMSKVHVDPTKFLLTEYFTRSGGKDAVPLGRHMRAGRNKN